MDTGLAARDILDLDTAAVAYDDTDFDDHQVPDLELHELGFAASRGSQLAVLDAPEPSAAGCAASDWGDTAHVSSLSEERPVCVQTNEGRIGAITVVELEKNSNGSIYSVEFDYIVWKKSDDP